ncbi:apolipoprotein N-acyltransferase [Sulfidibacter corallicola]
MRLMKILALGLLAAVFLNFSVAPFQWGVLGFVALMPLLHLRTLSALRRFLIGWFAGFLTQAFTYYWVFYTIRDFGGLSPWIAALGSTAFWLYQGLDLALWLWAYPLLAQKLGSRVTSNWTPVCHALTAAATWWLLQKGLFPYVFPWNYGSIFASLPWLFESVALWGVHGLGFLAVWFQAGLMEGMRRREASGRSRFALSVAAPLVLILTGLPFHRQVPTETWRIAVVQPNLIPWAKRGRLTLEERVGAHLRPTLGLKGRDVDMVVWPETAMSFVLSGFDRERRQLQFLCRELGAPLVTGTVGKAETGEYYNEIWMFTPDGAEPQVYRKQKLVWFSEQLPWVFSWARWFDPNMGGFAPGRETNAFRWRDRHFVPLVCFEALLPDYVDRFRGHAILNLTNDAWFGQTKASALHLQMIRGRAPEHGIPMVRATNSGISCWIDRRGVVHDPTGLYTAETAIFEVPVPTTPGTSRFSWAQAFLLGLTGLSVGLTRWVGRAREPS